MGLTASCPFGFSRVGLNARAFILLRHTCESLVGDDRFLRVTRCVCGVGSPCEEEGDRQVAVALGRVWAFDCWVCSGL